MARTQRTIPTDVGTGSFLVVSIPMPLIDILDGDLRTAALLNTIMLRAQSMDAPVKRGSLAFYELSWKRIWNTLRIKEWRQGRTSLDKLKKLGFIHTTTVRQGSTAKLHIAVDADALGAALKRWGAR